MPALCSPRRVGGAIISESGGGIIPLQGAELSRNRGRLPQESASLAASPKIACLGPIKRRTASKPGAWSSVARPDLGARVRIGCHTFRATGITSYLEAGGTLENAQVMAGRA
jgi:hypothetical protein